MLSRYRLHVWCFAVFFVLPLSLHAATRHVALIDAVKKSDIATVRALLMKGGVNTAESDGMTALHWAVHLDDAKMTSILLEAGAKVQVVNDYQVTPLALACMNGNAVIIEQLLRAGADPNTTMAEGETALMTAARTGQVSAVRAL